jgi:hypothetical protein
MVACGSKIPFKKQQPLKNSALIYIYVPDMPTSGDDIQTYRYSIRINNKKYKESIAEGEYLSLNLKPITIYISAIRGEVEEHKLRISMKAGEIYYLKIQKHDDLSFSFEMVENNVALGEIAKTGLAGSMVDDNSSIITELINQKDDNKEDLIKQTQYSVEVQNSVSQSSTTKRVTVSKLDEIKKAYEMKKEGIISDNEFEIIKSEILAK